MGVSDANAGGGFDFDRSDHRIADALIWIEQAWFPGRAGELCWDGQAAWMKGDRKADWKLVLNEVYRTDDLVFE